MKFYRDKSKDDFYYHDKIVFDNLSSIYYDNYNIIFFKNGKRHNVKNVAHFIKDGSKLFYLNDECHSTDFTKNS